MLRKGWSGRDDGEVSEVLKCKGQAPRVARHLPNILLPELVAYLTCLTLVPGLSEDSSSNCDCLSCPQNSLEKKTIYK